MFEALERISQAVSELETEIDHAEAIDAFLLTTRIGALIGTLETLFDKIEGTR